jgi:hypothetical protein
MRPPKAQEVLYKIYVTICTQAFLDELLRATRWLFQVGASRQPRISGCVIRLNKNAVDWRNFEVRRSVKIEGKLGFFGRR